MLYGCSVLTTLILVRPLCLCFVFVMFLLCSRCVGFMSLLYLCFDCAVFPLCRCVPVLSLLCLHCVSDVSLLHRSCMSFVSLLGLCCSSVVSLFVSTMYTDLNLSWISAVSPLCVSAVSDVSLMYLCCISAVCLLCVRVSAPSVLWFCCTHFTVVRGYYIVNEHCTLTNVRKNWNTISVNKRL